MGQPVPTQPGEQTTWFRQSGSWLTLSLRPDVFVKMSRRREERRLAVHQHRSEVLLVTLLVPCCALLQEGFPQKSGYCERDR